MLCFWSRVMMICQMEVTTMTQFVWYVPNPILPVNLVKSGSSALRVNLPHANGQPAPDMGPALTVAGDRPLIPDAHSVVKEETASKFLSLGTMASTKAGCQRSPPPITSLRKTSHGSANEQTDCLMAEAAVPYCAYPATPAEHQPYRAPSVVVYRLFERGERHKPILTVAGDRH
ncbi:unnamed protein product [Spodoptera exigua]|nr:unnamed protein product [Spodoptera exigua]